MEDPLAALRAPVPSEHESFGGLVVRLGDDVRRIVRAEIGLVQLRVSAALEAGRTAGVGLGLRLLLALRGLGAVGLAVGFARDERRAGRATSVIAAAVAGAIIYRLTR